VTFPLSSALAASFEHVETTGSTNTDLVDREPARHGDVIATLRQTAGRGRLDRSWSAPTDRTLAASVLLDPRGLVAESRGWVPLLAGVAMRASLASLVAPGDGVVGLKWPNDVQIDGRKVCGVLAQARPDGRIVVGVGVNLTVPAELLPTATSTSLGLHGVEGDAPALADRVLSAFLADALASFDALVYAAGDARVSGLHARVEAECSTLGRDVRVELPGGAELHGIATGLDPVGRLIVRPASGDDVAVSSGDVTHLRYE
jgi:BirA family biotin operon repressor/biotin-[acetyl-CoA-carboxylase] ligase